MSLQGHVRPYSRVVFVQQLAEMIEYKPGGQSWMSHMPQKAASGKADW